MTYALRQAAMRAILMFHNCEGQSHKTASTDHNFWRERSTEADSNRGPSAYQPNALPLGRTGSLHHKRLEPSFNCHHLSNFTRHSGTSLAAASTTCSQLPQLHAHEPSSLLIFFTLFDHLLFFKWHRSHTKVHHHQSQLRSRRPGERRRWQLLEEGT